MGDLVRGTVSPRVFEAGKKRFGFRLVQFSVQSNHMHLIAEAEDSRALSRDVQALGVRLARAVSWAGRLACSPTATTRAS